VSDTGYNSVGYAEGEAGYNFSPDVQLFLGELIHLTDVLTKGQVRSLTEFLFVSDQVGKSLSSRILTEQVKLGVWFGTDKKSEIWRS
jgi:hypothetical protein